MATINDLNEYCLTEIFSYLDIRERQKLELVCKRWRKMIQSFWLSRTKFEYSVSGSDSPFYLVPVGANGLKLKSNNVSHFGGILRKLNGNIEKLTITTDFRYNQPVDIPNWIFKLIIKNENINSLEIDLNNKPIYKNCLTILKTDNLQHLKLCRPNSFGRSRSVSNIIKKVFLNVPRLETLHLSNVEISMKKINKITTLKSLYISSMNKSLARHVRKFNFINLESIHLSLCPFLKDNFIKQLVKDCPKLRNVEVHTCSSINKKTLIPITTLPELRHFGATWFEDEVFDKLSNLESLTCRFLTLNENTKETSMRNFFRRSPNLKKAKVHVNGDPDLFDQYARDLGIVLNEDREFYHSCYCTINWNKQFNN